MQNVAKCCRTSQLQIEHCYKLSIDMKLLLSAPLLLFALVLLLGAGAAEVKQEADQGRLLTINPKCANIKYEAVSDQNWSLYLEL